MWNELKLSSMSDFYSLSPLCSQSFEFTSINVLILREFFFVRITPFSPTDDIVHSSRHNCHYVTVAHNTGRKNLQSNSTDDDDLTKLTDNHDRFYTEDQKVIQNFKRQYMFLLNLHTTR